MSIRLKRAYEPSEPGDGFRILVDRLWPRGVSKNSAKIDLWLKDIAPSTSLRKWFGHEQGKWLEFKARYAAELADNSELVGQLMAHTRGRAVTLVYAAKDKEHNDAVALLEYLKSHRSRS